MGECLDVARGRPLGAPAGSDVAGNGLAGELEEIELLEACHDLSEVGQEQRFQLRVFDVAGRDEQQLAGASLQVERAYEIFILGDQDVLVMDREIAEAAVRGPVAQWEIKSMADLVALLPQADSQPAGQLGVDQKFHATRGTTRFVWLSFAANSKAARMSSRSRSS